MSDFLETRRDFEDAAADWVVRHAAGLTPATRADFERWLAADPRHYAAFAEAELALSVLSPPTDAQQREALRAELAAGERTRRLWRDRRYAFGFAAAGLAAAAAVVFAFLPDRSQPQSALPPVAAAIMVRPFVQNLPDGTVVELNANADLAVNFTHEVRDVRLLRGEAHFAVAKDSTRPFVVSAGAIKVRAVGTAFNVRLNPDVIEVLVTEGNVRVTDESRADQNGSIPVNAVAMSNSRRKAAAANFPPSDLLVGAGYRTAIPLTAEASKASVVAPVSLQEIERELAWRGMRFEISNATLEEAVTLFNRKGGVRFEIRDSELRLQRITGIYWADNPMQFAELIESTLDIKAVRQGPDRILFCRE